LIYWVQKRTLRRKQAVVYKKDYQKLVSWSQCFECEMKVDYTKPYCPFCAEKLHTQCKACGEVINKHEPYCSHCSKEVIIPE
jgi:predicted amidophosphoribosyltransferase